MAAWANYGTTIRYNDSDEFAVYLEESAVALRQGRIFFPVSDFDCPPTFLLVGGLAKIITGWPPVRILNFFAIGCTFLSAIAAFAFFRRLKADIAPSLVASVSYQASNFLQFSHHEGHMNYVQLQWLPLAFLCLLAMLRTPSRWLPAVGLGVVMGLQILTSPALTLYMGYVALPTFFVAYWFMKWRSGEGAGRDLARLIGRGIVAVGIALVIASFYLIPRLGHPPQHFPRPLSNVLAFVLYDPAQLLDATHPMLFLGWPTLIAGLFAVHWCWKNRTPDAVALVCTGFAALVMMMPARFGMPYWAMWRFGPMIDHTRVPNRFFPIFLLLVLATISVYLSRNWPKSIRPSLILFFALLVGNWLASPWIIEIDLYVALDGIGRRLQTLTGVNLGVL